MVTVLIISGDKALGEFYAEYFAHTDIAVVPIPAWKDAIDYLEVNQPPALILLEMRLPDGSGQPVIGYLRTFTKYEKTQVIILTDERASSPSRPRLGIEHILYKPAVLSELGEYMTNLLTAVQHV